MTGSTGADQAQNLKEVSRELQRVNRTLRQLARLGVAHRRAPSVPRIDAAAVRAILAVRRLRDEHLGPALDDQAWIVLLEAFAARLDGHLSAMNRLGSGPGLARSTAQRRVAWLLEQGLLVRGSGRSSGYGVLVGPSDDAARRVADYLAEAARLSPWAL